MSDADWMDVGSLRFFEWFFKEGEDLLEIRAAMRRLGLDPNDEEQIRKYFEQHADDKFVKHYLGKQTWSDW
jgi:hypothetical protein